MSEEASNVEILRAAYRRWHDSRGTSVDCWISLCTDDVRFGSIAEHEPAVPYMTLYTDRARLADYFNGLARDWEMIEFRGDHFVAQGDRVVVLGHCSWRARKTGKVVRTPMANSFRMRDGRISEYYEYFDTAQVRDAMN